MFAFTRFSKSVQLNVFSRNEEFREVETHGYLELSLTFGNTEHMRRQDKRFSKTVKFYCSPGGVGFEHTAGGKALSYVNKLLFGNWINDEEYDVLYGAIQVVIASDSYIAAMAEEHPGMDVHLFPASSFALTPPEEYGRTVLHASGQLESLAAQMRLNIPVVGPKKN